MGKRSGLPPVMRWELRIIGGLYREIEQLNMFDRAYGCFYFISSHRHTNPCWDPSERKLT